MMNWQSRQLPFPGLFPAYSGREKLPPPAVYAISESVVSSSPILNNVLIHSPLCVHSTSWRIVSGLLLTNLNQLESGRWADLGDSHAELFLVYLVSEQNYTLSPCPSSPPHDSRPSQRGLQLSHGVR